MAGIRSILGVLNALRRISVRDLQSFRSVAAQNLFLFVALVALQPESAAFFGVILCLVILFPLSSDPMAKIPAERRSLWPLSRREWVSIRLVSFTLSPIAPFLAVLLWKAGWRLGAVAAAVALTPRAIGRLGTGRSSANWLAVIPAPPGIIGAIARLHCRELLQTLDVYVALALAASAEIYRYSSKHLDTAAPHVLSGVVVLALSTATQVSLALDGAGAERYRLTPIRGWQILLGKDLVFLGVVVLFVIPFDLAAGAAGALAALAIGHHRSVVQAIPQARWRFTSGVLIPDGLLQVVAIFAASNGVFEAGWRVVLACFAAWLVSLFLYGRYWDAGQSQ